MAIEATYTEKVLLQEAMKRIEKALMGNNINGRILPEHIFGFNIQKGEYEIRITLNLEFVLDATREEIDPDEWEVPAQ